MKSIRIGTRGSKLALTQAIWVEQQLRQQEPQLEIEQVVIKTSGDQQQGQTAAEAGARKKGLFVKELEEALLSDQIDVAVHSAKDLETQLPDGVVIAAVPNREDLRDVWITREGKSLADLPAESKVGVSSVRRIAQLKRKRNDFQKGRHHE